MSNDSSANSFTVDFICKGRLGIRFLENSETDKRGRVEELVATRLPNGTITIGQAQRLGVQVGDVCTAVGGTPINVFPIPAQRSQMQAADTVSVTFQRNGPVPKVARAPGMKSTASASRPRSDSTTRQLLSREIEMLKNNEASQDKMIIGMEAKLKQLKSELKSDKSHFNAISDRSSVAFFTVAFNCEKSLGIRFVEIGKTDARGMVKKLLSTDADEPGQAQSLGVQVGDVCTAVGGTPIDDFPIAALKSQMQAADTVSVTFQRNHWKVISKGSDELISRVLLNVNT